MTTKAKKKFRSKSAEAAHETASGLHRIGVLDAKTMREFDAACLTMIEPLTGAQILALREREGVFARVLNVKPKLVSEWERGEKKPSGPSPKLLSIVKARGLGAII
ncbi:transcriptional regulator [Methylocystis sp. B8]|uniref:helix-turn-helix domain-containing protein n=1 Tax=Methylocystis sp. B8 TaxID=544938 RepID=UPI0010FD360D|nr:transcriptional regulator [Methylocystis sp. B8]TLG75589.1 transcriptional regulator [Methylocystis sp. B8]